MTVSPVLLTFSEGLSVYQIFGVFEVTDEHSSFINLVEHLASPLGQARVHHLEHRDELRQQPHPGL